MQDSATSPARHNPVGRIFEAPVRLMQIVVGWALVLLCLATTYEIIVRRLFGISVQGINEIGAYLLAIGSSWGFSISLIQRAHSRVDFLFQYFPKPLQAALNAIAAVSLAGLAIFAAWEGWWVLSETLQWQARANTPLQTPLWIPQGLWLLGLIVFAAVAGSLAVHALILLFTNRAALDEFYGPPSIMEQIDIETQGTLPKSSEGVF
jgi:TRAP-type C4-dicarboxylate transport system permease small subunit